MIPLICLRETPAASANSVAVTPCGAKYNSRSILPGAVGRRVRLQTSVIVPFRIVPWRIIAPTNSVVVFEVHVEDVSLIALLEAEGHAHIPASLHCALLLALPFEPVETVGTAQVISAGRTVHRVKDHRQPLVVLLPDFSSFTFAKQFL